jgi:hypothetical protein
MEELRGGDMKQIFEEEGKLLTLQEPAVEDGGRSDAPPPSPPPYFQDNSRIFHFKAKVVIKSRNRGGGGLTSPFTIGFCSSVY